MSTGERAVQLLESIDRSLKQLLKQSSAAEMASDRDLDGPHGDPQIKMSDPRDWTGPPMKGRRFSECPPEYLDMLAARFDYFAEKAEEKNETYNNKPVAPYKRADARRARGWAARIRSGRHVQTTLAEEAAEMGEGSDWAGSHEF